MRVYNKTGPAVQAGADAFDLRQRIRPGDTVRGWSMKACDTEDQVTRKEPILAEGIVLAVYERFVLVRLKRVRDCFNRHDIANVNGKALGNPVGRLGGTIR
jgi:hypothetical protein